ncbi:MAG TPA: amidohydrolase family protein [Pyrinomonadaceae bacterium]
MKVCRIRNLAAALMLALVLSAAPTRADDLAFSHVTVVDVVEGRLVRDRVVRVAGGRIVEVAPAAGARIPKGTRVVDARGKFLIPGLWDMHTHLLGGVPPGCPEVTFPLMVAHGITGVREVGSYLDFLYAWREEVESGRSVGPRIVGTDRLIDGVPPVYPGIASVATTPGNARQTVDILSRRGADFVKAYEMLSRDAFFALVEQAKKSGLPVVAHVPLSVLAGEASDAGVRSFEHLRNIEFACSREADTLLAERIALLEAGVGRVGSELRSEIHSAQRTRAYDTYDPGRCTALLRKFAANGTWQTPTLFLNTREVRRPDLLEDVRERLRWVPDRQRAEWEAWTKGVTSMKPEAAAALRRRADWEVQLVRRMNEEGVGLLAGTDVATPWTVPGAALHDELSALVEAGLTPLESLRTATLNPARYFEKTGEFGAVAPGMAADLVLIDGDPLADIRNTRRISGVVANGRYLDRPALDRMLAEAERLARDGGHDPIHRPGRGRPSK